MSEEEKKAIEYWKRDIALYHWNTQLASEHYVQIILNLIEKQQKELEEYERIFDVFNERKYRKKYLEERRKEEPNLLYPDTDEIYQKYYEEKEKNKELEAENFSLNEMKRYNQKHYISKEKIRELLENEMIDISGFRCIAVEDIEELLEEK